MIRFVNVAESKAKAAAPEMSGPESMGRPAEAPVPVSDAASPPKTAEGSKASGPVKASKPVKATKPVKSAKAAKDTNPVKASVAAIPG